jgi:hypothetical protein
MGLDNVERLRQEQAAMSDTITATSRAPSKTCDCCKENVRIVDEDGLCFNCDLVQTFAIIIAEQADIAGDAAIDLAGDLAEYARSRILEVRDDDKAKDFFADVGIGMVRGSKVH